MITFASEPGVFSDYIPGEQFPGLPGGVRFPALVGESQTFILRQNVPIVKGGLLSFSYNSLSGLLTTGTVVGPDEVLNITALRKNGLDFELTMLGNSTAQVDLSDISLLQADFSQIRVGSGVVTPAVAPVNHTINITGAGYSSPVITINAGDSITWTNLSAIAHGIQNDATSSVIFSSTPTNIGPTQSFTPTPTPFTVTGTYTYHDPLLPQDTTFTGVIIVEPVLGYTYSNSTRELTFTFDVPVAKNVIEIDTIFNVSTLPVTIKLDGSGIEGPYDVDISPPQIQQITSVSLIDISDPLPDSNISSIVRVGNIPFATDYTPLDYLLINNSIDWGAAVSVGTASPPNVVNTLSVEKFSDKIFTTVGDDLVVKDNTWILTVVTVGPVGVGTYRINNGTTGALVGTFTTSAAIVPTSPIPGVNLTVIDTTGSTTGDSVVVTTNAGTESEPAAGDRYYVTYRVTKTDFSPKLIFSFKDVKTVFGPIVQSYNANGSINKLNNLSLAAFLAMMNGAPGVVLTQTAFGMDGTSTSTDFIEAIDSLLTVDSVGTVVPLTSDTIVRDYAQVHVELASDREHRNERVAFVSAPAGSTIDELIGIATGYSSKRVVLVTPTAAQTEVQDQFGNPLLVTIEGFFIAAAFSGLNQSTRFDVAEPMTRKAVVGFTQLVGEFQKPERDRLSAAGVLTVQTIGTSFVIRQGITTSTNSIEERELSVTKITDFTARAVRAACERFIGTKLIDETPIWVSAAISGILQTLVHDNIINAFTGVQATVDTSRPDTLDCSFSFKPVYPVNFIQVTFSINGAL